MVILEKLLQGAANEEDGAGVGVQLSSTTVSDLDDPEHAARGLLARLLINSANVVLREKVGAGSFGDVFRATYLDQTVAVKTMRDVSERSARSFRSEILLTSSLCHPNVVAFVGCCWGRDLIGLILEWVPRGSLGKSALLRGSRYFFF